MEHAGANVILNISSVCLQLTGVETGVIIAKHEMPKISFASSGDTVSIFVLLNDSRKSSENLKRPQKVFRKPQKVLESFQKTSKDPKRSQKPKKTLESYSENLKRSYKVFRKPQKTLKSLQKTSKDPKKSSENVKRP
jgi:hypothetical protein